MISRSKYVLRSWVLSVAFVACLYVPPLVMMVLPARTVSEIEKRPLAPFPVLEWDSRSWAEFPSRFNAYMNDHIGFRDGFMKWRAWVSIRLLQSAPISSMMIGKDGWFFWNKHFLAEDFRGRHLMTSADLAIYLQGLRCKSQWLSQNGMRYVLMIVPEKQTIYPEFLPDHLQQRRGKTRFEQLREALAYGYPDIEPLCFLDIRDVLISEKRKHLVYYRTDTHWNFRGGFVGYEVLMQRLSNWFPDVGPKPRDFFREAVIRNEEGGDLVQMVNLHGLLREDRPVFQPQFVCSNRWDVDVPDQTVPSFAMGCPDQRLKAVVFRDSYFNYMLPFVSEHFQEIVYVWNGYDPTILETIAAQLHPDIVIEEYLERFLSASPVSHRGNWEMIQAMSQRNFDAAPISFGQIVSPRGLVPIHDVVLESDTFPIVLRASGIDPYLLLPFDIPRQAIHLYLKIDISASEATELQAFYLVSDHRTYDETYMAEAPLRSGRNTVYLTLPGTDFNGPIRLDPGKKPGIYTIESIEMRTDAIGSLNAIQNKGGS